LFFQTLDDKKECVGLYADGKLFFEDLPSDNLTHTWKPTASFSNEDVEYAWIRAQGKELNEASPPAVKEDLERATRRLGAYLKAFKLGKINLREHCFFDLVPYDFLMEYCEIKNKISKHVFNNYPKPPNYGHLVRIQKLLQKIKNQNLNIDATNCKELFLASTQRKTVNNLLNGPSHINYNLFGTITGRLTTSPNSFPILTLKKEFRKLIKPCNDWLLSLDYNGAEVRTLLALSQQKQPDTDIHTWNIQNIFGGASTSRDEAKTMFFAWLYNPDSSSIETSYYDREKVLKRWYHNNTIETPFKRQIKVDERKAFNYLIQSTTADLVLERAVEIDNFLKDKQSFISHIVHDEIVIDLANEDRHEIAEIKSIFSNNKLAKYMVNLQCGKNYLELKELKL